MMKGWHASDFVGQSNSELSPAVQSLSRLTNVTFLSSTAFDHFLRLSCTCWLCHSRVSSILYLVIFQFLYMYVEINLRRFADHLGNGSTFQNKL